MKRLLLLTMFAATSAFAATGPYNPEADANADVQQALSQAAANHKPVLLFFGANWCPDCRTLAKSLEVGKNAELMVTHFNIVKIDVGNFNYNLDVVKRFGNPIKKGIPAAVIASADGKVLYSTRAGELSSARNMSDQGVYDFFTKAIASVQAAK
ncbi:MAG: thioredoxin family protein [Rudaea sp.]